jgi:hypothetical protein
LVDWKDCKNSGPWNFVPQEDKYGYINNALWSGQADAQAFCEDQGLTLDLPSQHLPCGHFHKAEVTEEPFPAGKWVAAMQQPGTPYIYVYDILYKAVIRINTSEIPVFVESRLILDSTYDLDYDMGYGNPGTQKGGYCMNKDATRIWYLFCDQGQHPITRDYPDAELVEVDISKTVMRVVKKTVFPGLLPAEAFPGLNAGRVNDGCSDDMHTYWCTDLIAGRIIKIRNSDHSIIDDHTFNYAIEGGSGNSLDEPISTIDVDKNVGRLFWVYCRDHLYCSPPYNACRHLIRADTDLVADIDSVTCASGSLTPAWQNMIRLYSNYVFHHRAYYPTTVGYLMKRNLAFSPSGDQVRGTDGQIYSCILSHTSDASNLPITGGSWVLYWVLDGATGGTWAAGVDYSAGHLTQEYLQNIFGVKNDKVFTLMHLNTTEHPAFLYCLDFGNMDEVSKLDVSYYAGQIYPPGGYDWDWTSVSAMNYQTGVIAIFRYHNVEERNYVGCFDASPSLEFLCDVPLYAIRHVSSPEALDEPQVWPLEGFVSPEIPEADPPVSVISDPGPGEVIYEPPLIPPDDVPDDGVTLLQSGFTDYFDIGPGQTLFFKIVAAVNVCVQPIQIGNTPQSQEPHTVHLLIKRGSKPTIGDYEWLMQLGSYLYDCGDARYYPEKPVGTEDYFWRFGTGSSGEFVEIRESLATNTFYIMLYNAGTRSVRNQRLTIYYW